MESSEAMPLSLEGFRQEQLAKELSPGPEAGLESVTEYFQGLKLPYLTLQAAIRQRLQEENEHMSWCLQDMFTRPDRKNELTKRMKEHQEQIDELEEGLRWADQKIRDLEEQMSATVILKQASLL